MLTALFKAILDWLTDLAKQDTKAGDADSIPQSLKDRWRQRIEEQENKSKDSKNEEDSDITDQLCFLNWVRFNQGCFCGYTRSLGQNGTKC